MTANKGRIQRRYNCEICGKSGTKISTDDICRECDFQIRESTRLAEEKTLATAAKRKCRICNNPLPPSRYFHCTECIRPDDMPSDDPTWEHVPTLDAFEEKPKGKRGAPKRTPLSIGLTKECRACHVVKPRTEFFRKPNCRDPHHSYCKICYQEKRNQWKSYKDTLAGASE